MNILQVVEASYAGVGRHVRNLCEGLVDHGQRVTVAYSPQRTDEVFRQFVSNRWGEIDFVPLDVRREVSPVSDLRAVLRLTRLMMTCGPFDIVHGHSSKGGAIARVAGRIIGLPTVYTPHGLIMSYPETSRVALAVYTAIERTLGRLATSKFVAVSEDERRFASCLALVSQERIAVIPNTIDDRDFEYATKQTDNKDVNDAPLTFGSTMRFDPEKAPHLLVEAFISLTHMLPGLPMRLVVAGDGKLFAETRRRVETSGLSDRISLLGWRTDMREVLRQFDVFVVPSFCESGLSYSTMEAMAVGLPIVSTDVFGARSSLTRVPGNVLVPAGDIGTLAAGMKKIATLDDPVALRRVLRDIGLANRNYVRHNFGQSKISYQMLEAYRTLC